MEIELILLGVIAIVVVTDFVLRGLKKKSSNDEDVPKIEDQFNDIIKENKFSYILSRKRNIITFLLLTAILKPVIHYAFFNDKSTVYSTEKIDLGSWRTFTDYYLKDSIGNLYKVNSADYGTNGWFSSVQPVKDRDERFDFLHNGGIFTSNGEKLYTGIDESIFKYKKEKISFNEYLNERFLLKPYIFIISFGIMLMFVLLFNDKIKAR